ncbi:hypothetical protein GQ44DRAFT_363351 [Phaeosphaeriaceae sp. PMI808]|nr:hypothetical protein GQ44DRAFT_363351 [Phaeosphaeriaceae sp. PMI808]
MISTGLGVRDGPRYTHGKADQAEISHGFSHDCGGGGNGVVYICVYVCVCVCLLEGFKGSTNCVVMCLLVVGVGVGVGVESAAALRANQMGNWSSVKLLGNCWEAVGGGRAAEEEVEKSWRGAMQISRFSETEEFGCRAGQLNWLLLQRDARAASI